MLEVDLVNNINHYLEMKGIRFSNELRMGIGIPDITLNLGANYRLKPIDDYFLITILAFVNEKRIVTFSQIQDKFLMGLEKVKQYVSTLVNLHLVEIKNALIKIVKNIFSVDLGVTISIEAKLRDWKGAFLQAQRYLCFSDYSYVALPSEIIKNVDSNVFLESGIGLLSIQGENIEVVLHARKSTNCNHTLKYICTSKVIEKNLNFEKRHIRPNVFSLLI